MDESRQVADEALLWHQRTLRGAGRSARVDEKRGIRRARGDRIEIARRLAEQGVPVDGPRLARACHADHAVELRQALADRGEVGERRGVHDRGLAFRILQPVFERFGPEEKRQRHGHRAHLIAGDVRHRSFRSLRQHDRNLVAARDTVRTERIGEPIGLLLQLCIGETRGGTRLVFPIQGNARCLARVARAHRARDVEIRRHLPAVRSADRPVAVFPHSESRPQGAATCRGACSTDSTVAQTQSGCCSRRRPKAIFRDVCPTFMRRRLLG